MRTAALAAIAVLFGTTQGYAFDPAQADIIGLHLGMADSEVTAELLRQGFAVIRDHASLLANTLDGRISVAIGPDHAAHEIRYTLRGAGAGEGAKIQTSVIDRFGQPNQSNPMGWCRVIRRDGVCPDGAPLLTFRPDTLTLVLRAGAPDGK